MLSIDPAVDWSAKYGPCIADRRVAHVYSCALNSPVVSEPLMKTCTARYSVQRRVS